MNYAIEILEEHKRIVTEEIKKEEPFQQAEYNKMLTNINDALNKLNIDSVSERFICACGNPKVEHSCQNCNGEIKYS
tara:strand:- start:38857 stop:39087 length:231 start_codon:yes stop_codon:yes gene_type:complete